MNHEHCAPLEAPARHIQMTLTSFPLIDMENIFLQEGAQVDVRGITKIESTELHEYLQLQGKTSPKRPTENMAEDKKILLAIKIEDWIFSEIFQFL